MVTHRFTQVFILHINLKVVIKVNARRLIAGGVGAQFWSAYVPCKAQYKDAVQMTLEQIDAIKRLVQREPHAMEMAKTVEDIRNVHKRGKIASLIGVEGILSSVENSEQVNKT